MEWVALRSQPTSLRNVVKGMLPADGMWLWAAASRLRQDARGQGAEAPF